MWFCGLEAWGSGNGLGQRDCDDAPQMLDWGYGLQRMCIDGNASAALTSGHGRVTVGQCLQRQTLA